MFLGTRTPNKNDNMYLYWWLNLCYFGFYLCSTITYLHFKQTPLDYIHSPKDEDKVETKIFYFL